MTASVHNTRLIPHAAAPHPALDSIEVSVQRTDTQLVLQYRLQGKLSALSIPAPDSAEQRDGLWQHTCCEVFIRTGNDDRYQEFNFSPAGHWAAYEFDNYRDGMRPLSVMPAVHCESDEHALLLIATLPLASAAQRQTLRLGLSAVIESGDGGLSYWALTHPGERPDFHHRAGHCLAIEALT